tara:strand:+ start:72 stop:344 length:273 start_codon:yes stop_codon:yes gene_type:complete
MDKKEVHEATKGTHTTTYNPDIEDILHLIQLETQFEKGWISDVKEERIKAIEWGLKVLQVQELTEVNFYLDRIRDELQAIRIAIYDTNGD